MTTPTPPPTYVYKILPSSAAPPSPLPLALPVSEHDNRDGFIHLSTSTQILGTLQNFFKEEEHVYILRLPYDGISKYIKWEDAKGKQPDEQGGCWDVEGKMGYFPHIHGNGMKVGKEEVDEVGLWKRARSGWSPEEWPFEDDKPKELVL